MLIPISDRANWENHLKHFTLHDVYHTPGYHVVEQQRGCGTPFLFVCELESARAALPILIREIPGTNYSDASTVYGYPGLLCSCTHDAAEAQSLKEALKQQLNDDLRKEKVISLFIRQNPLINTTWLLEPLGEVLQHGPTVAIDLSNPVEEQLLQIRKDHRYDIRKARRTGFEIKQDPEFTRLDEFLDIYQQTMDRVGATPEYYFNKEYFQNLRKQLGGQITLMFAERESQTVSASIFTMSGGIIQYHLSGTATESLKYRAGMKVLLDEMRLIGTAEGYRWLHLGGGLGAKEDSLFEFKSGFSKHYCTFETVRIIVDQEKYAQLTEKRHEALRNADQEPQVDFFPGYRQS